MKRKKDFLDNLFPAIILLSLLLGGASVAFCVWFMLELLERL